MRNSIKSEVNGTIWKGFNKELLIKRHFSTKSKRSRTSPFSQPVNRVDQILMKSLTIAFEIFFNMVKDSLFPILISIVEIPLVAIAHHTNVTWSWNYVSSRLVVDKSICSIYELLSYQTFGLCNFYSFEVTNQHHSFMESFFVWLVFCLLQKLLIILTLNL
jgi:hypothetical protein